MQRYEDALRNIGLGDGRSLAVLAPLLKRYTVAARELQRALTPRNGSVHAAISRASEDPGKLTTSIFWVSCYDRVGLFNIDSLWPAWWMLVYGTFGAKRSLTGWLRLLRQRGTALSLRGSGRAVASGWRGVVLRRALRTRHRAVHPPTHLR